MPRNILSRLKFDDARILPKPVAALLDQFAAAQLSSLIFWVHLSLSIPNRLTLYIVGVQTNTFVSEILVITIPIPFNVKAVKHFHLISPTVAYR